MTQHMTQNLTELNQQWIGTLVDLQKLTGEMTQSLVRQQCEAVVGLVGLTSRHYQSACQVRSVEETVSNQARFFSEMGETMLKNSLELMGSFQKFQVHYGQVLGSDLSALFYQSMRQCMQFAPPLSTLHPRQAMQKGTLIKEVA